MAALRAADTPKQTAACLEAVHLAPAASRASENAEQNDARLDAD